MSELVLQFVDLLERGGLGLAVLHQRRHVEHVVQVRGYLHLEKWNNSVMLRPDVADICSEYWCENYFQLADICTWKCGIVV